MDYFSLSLSIALGLLAGYALIHLCRLAISRLQKSGRPIVAKTVLALRPKPPAKLYRRRFTYADGTSLDRVGSGEDVMQWTDAFGQELKPGVKLVKVQDV